MRVVDLWLDKMAAYWALCGQPGRASPRDLRNAEGQRSACLTAVWAGISRVRLSREINLSGPAAGQQTQPEKAPCSGTAQHPSLSVWSYRESETWQGESIMGGEIADGTGTSNNTKWNCFCLKESPFRTSEYRALTILQSVIQ